MANSIRIKRRAAGGGTGAPSSLLNAELAFNEDDSKLYIGIGDNGQGVATSVLTLGGPGATMQLAGAQTVLGDKTFQADVNLTGGFKLNGVEITATAAELNRIVGVTSGIQSQFDAITADITQNRTAIGIADGDLHLGVFGGTGTTLSDNITVKAALEELEAALEDGAGALAGDSGSAAFSGGSVSIAGGTGLTTNGNSNTLTVSLDDTAVSAAAYGAADSVGTFTVDAQGRLTAASNTAISIVHTQVSDFDSGVQANTLDSLAAPVANVELNNQRITGLADPVSDSDAVNKRYADALVNGLDVKNSVRVATDANITLENLQTIDGVSLAAGDRVLVKEQTNGADNGIYDVVDGGAWTRSADADNNPGSEITSGMYVFVEDGSSFANNGFVLQTTGAINLGVTVLSFVQFSGTGQVIAGTGLSKTGNQIDIGTADSSRIVVNADSIDLATHGSAGTYNGLTVDAYGRVSSFAQPTTLAGYSISDAQPLDATLTALAGVTVGANELIYSTGADAFSTTALSTYMRALLDDTDSATARTTLGLGTMATQAASAVNITGGTIDNVTLDGGTF